MRPCKLTCLINWQMDRQKCRALLKLANASPTDCNAYCVHCAYFGCAGNGATAATSLPLPVMRCAETRPTGPGACVPSPCGGETPCGQCGAI